MGSGNPFGFHPDSAWRSFVFESVLWAIAECPESTVVASKFGAHACGGHEICAHYLGRHEGGQREATTGPPNVIHESLEWVDTERRLLVPVIVRSWRRAHIWPEFRMSAVRSQSQRESTGALRFLALIG